MRGDLHYNLQTFHQRTFCDISTKRHYQEVELQGLFVRHLAFNLVCIKIYGAYG
jgi:hypothetical protein